MNINGALFLTLTNMTFQNSFAVINVFCAELPIFLREHFNGMYRTDVYYLCKQLAELPIFLLIPIIFVCIYYWMVGFNEEVDRFLVCNLIVILVVQVVVSFGQLQISQFPAISLQKKHFFFHRLLRLLHRSQPPGGPGAGASAHHPGHALRRILPQQQVGIRIHAKHTFPQ